MCPHSTHLRRCSHHPPAAEHSRQPVPVGLVARLMPSFSGFIGQLTGTDRDHDGCIRAETPPLVTIVSCQSFARRVNVSAAACGVTTRFGNPDGPFGTPHAHVAQARGPPRRRRSWSRTRITLGSRGATAAEPIVDQGIFAPAQKLLADRRLEIPEEEMLLRLRLTLRRRGKLNSHIKYDAGSQSRLLVREALRFAAERLCADRICVAALLRLDRYPGFLGRRTIEACH